MDNLKVSLYDLLGYLLPGAIVLLALSICYWAAFGPTIPLPLGGLSVGAGMGITLVALILGHMVQAIANILPSALMCSEKEYFNPKTTTCLPHEIVLAAKKKLATTLATSPDDITTTALCDASRYATVSGSGAYEIFLSHEGLYRGLAVSMFLLACSLSFRALREGTAVEIGSSNFPISAGSLALTVIILLVFVCLSWRRYHRFARYRIGQMIYGYLLLPEKKEK